MLIVIELLFFCNYIFLSTITFVRFIHVVEHNNLDFFHSHSCILLSYVNITQVFFNQSSVDRFLAIMNNIASNNIKTCLL